MKDWTCLHCGEEWHGDEPTMCPCCGAYSIQVQEPEFTLRDFFAGCALIGEMLDTAIEGVICPAETEAKTAYLVADAMLEARKP